MTSSVTVRVNGNYQVPVVISGGDASSQTINVRGPTGPSQPATEQTFNLNTGQSITVGPETPAARNDTVSFTNEDYNKASGAAEASSAQGGRPSRTDALNPEEDRRDAAEGRIQTPQMENEQPEPGSPVPPRSQPDVND